jgi:hypothetical protein
MTPATDARLRLIAFGSLVSALAATLAISFLVTPEQIESGTIVLSPACPTRRFLGFECLSCGMTRAFTALGHGQLSRALDYNRLSPFVWLGVWIALPLAVRSAVRALRDLRQPLS